jgi:hypothetical protein
MIAQLMRIRMSGYGLDDVGSIPNRNCLLYGHIVSGPGILSFSAAVAAGVTLPLGKSIGLVPTSHFCLVLRFTICGACMTSVCLPGMIRGLVIS